MAGATAVLPEKTALAAAAEGKPQQRKAQNRGKALLHVGQFKTPHPKSEAKCELDRRDVHGRDTSKGNAASRLAQLVRGPQDEVQHLGDGAI